MASRWRMSGIFVLLGSMGQALVRASAGLVSVAASEVCEAMAIEVNAASRANATQDHSAGWKPAVTLAGVPRCP
jgi:hypothetical protein